MMKSGNLSLNNPITKRTIEGWHLVLRVVALAGLLVSMSLPFPQAPSLRAFAMDQPAPQSLNTSSHGPWGGYVTNLAVAPSDPDILYAWTEDDLFKSTNGGANWNHVGRAENSARQVAIDTFNSEILYVRPNVFPSPAYKSTDGGVSWNPIGPPNTPVQALAMNPATPTTLYTLDDKFRLSKSSDGGSTWSRTGNGLPEHTGRGNSVYVVLAVSPGNSQTLYAASPAESAENQGLYRTTDGGANWIRVGVGPFRNVAMLELTVAQASPNILYARTVEGWFRSTDNGANWSAFGFTNVSVQSLAIDPENAAIVYVGTSDGRVLKSADGGTSWSEAKVGLHISRLVIDPRNTKNIYAESVSGVFKSADGGGRWQETSSGIGAKIYFLGALGAGVLLADTHWNGLLRSTNNGETWERSSLPGLANLFAVDPNHPNLIFASTKDSVYKSTDAGATWSATQAGLSDVFLTTLAIVPGDPNTLYAGAYFANTKEYAVISSTDAGASWASLNKGLQVSPLLFDPTNPNTLYAVANSACDAGGYLDGSCPSVLKSTDGGASWSQSTTFSPASSTLLFETWLGALTLDPDNPRIIYAGLSDRRVFKSTDGGLTWSVTGLTSAPNLHFGYDNNLIIDPNDSETLYVGFRNVVYRSTDGGATWTELTTALPNDLEIRELAIDPSGTSLHVGTNRGVFDYQLATPCAEPLSPANQSFETGGGIGFAEVMAPTECGWTVESLADWIRVTSAGNGAGKGTVSYLVAANGGTAARTGRLSIAGHILKIAQAGAIVRIDRATVSGKKLLIVGENFDPGAVILINGEPQITRNDPQNPKTSLIGKKAGKKIKPGDKLQVQNPNGSLSAEFTFID